MSKIICFYLKRFKKQPPQYTYQKQDKKHYSLTINNLYRFIQKKKTKNSCQTDIQLPIKGNQPS